MKTRNKRIAGLAAVGMLAGGGLAGAFAAGSGQDDRAGDLARALSTQTGEQVTASDVKAAFKDVLAGRLKEGVAAGRITQAQADQMLKRAENALLPGGRGQAGPGHHGRGMGTHEVGTAVAKKLGMTKQQLRDARRSDTTLAALAASKGVEKADLIATVTSALIKQGPPPGMTAKTDAELAQIATDMVDGKGGPGHRRR